MLLTAQGAAKAELHLCVSSASEQLTALFTGLPRSTVQTSVQRSGIGAWL